MPDPDRDLVDHHTHVVGEQMEPGYDPPSASLSPPAAQPAQQPHTAPAAAGPHPGTPDGAAGAELDLDLIEARLDAATPGPWEHGDIWSWAGVVAPDECALCRSHGEPVWVGQADINGKLMLAHKHRNPDPYQPDHLVSGPDRLVAGNYDYEEGGILRRADARFIVAARQDVPALLAEVRRLRGLVSPAAGRVIETAVAARLAERNADDPGGWGRWQDAIEAHHAAVEALDAERALWARESDITGHGSGVSAGQPAGPRARPDPAPDLGVSTAEAEANVPAIQAAARAAAWDAERAPEPDSGPGWDREHIDAMIEGAGTVPDDAEQLRNLLADRDLWCRRAWKRREHGTRWLQERDDARAELAEVTADRDRLRSSLPVEAQDYWHWRAEAERLRARLADSIDPATIPDQQAQGWPDFHPEAYCHRCGRPNIGWYADSAIWNEVHGGSGPIWCPVCFARAYEEKTGQQVSWRLAPRDLSDEAAHLVASEAAMRHERNRMQRELERLKREVDTAWQAAGDMEARERHAAADALNEGARCIRHIFGDSIDPEVARYLDALAERTRAGTRLVPDRSQPPEGGGDDGE